MTLLICNVGGRELKLADAPELRDLKPRPLGERLRAEYATYRAQMSLPIIGKALRYVQAQAEPLQAVVLLASDQQASNPDFVDTDTGELAEVVRCCLSDETQHWQALPSEQVLVWTLSDAQGRGSDPADYDAVLACLERRLPELAKEFKEGPVYLEVTGGTPAMTTGLLVAGTEVFGTRTEILSIHPVHEQPAVLNTGKRLLAAPLRAALHSNAATFDYEAALRAFESERAIIVDRLHPAAPNLLAALLDYARCRYNFDFPGARHALPSALAAGTRWQAAVAALAADVTNPDRNARLGEVYHAAEARYRVGAFADFLTQLVRFEENVLRKLCLDCAQGSMFADRAGNDDEDGPLISRAWLDTQSIHLSNDFNPARDRPNSRSLMREVLESPVGRRKPNMTTILREIRRLEQLVYLRNDLTHNFDGVRKRDLATRFRQGAAETVADTIVPHMAQIYTLATGRVAGPSPYDRINELLTDLLSPVTPEEG